MTRTANEKYQIKVEIKQIDCINDNCRIVFLSPQLCAVARPGQFLMVKPGEGATHDPLMRRPFSIHKISHDEISIVFKIVGRGTKLLSTKKKSEYVNIVGPLGTGFDIKRTARHYLIGGGMGIAPLYFLAQGIKKFHPGSEITVLLGARNAGELEIFSEFYSLHDLGLRISTDDGSAGHHGLVLDLLKQAEIEKKECAVYCCGPLAMMKAVAEYCKLKKIPCQVSLETTMACGIGACLGCAVTGADMVKKSYVHVCKDGPVFEANKIWG